MIPIGPGRRSRTFPAVTYGLIAANVGVFVLMLTLSGALPPSALEQRREFREQTAGVCYGFRTLPTESDRFICQYGFQPREFFDVLRGEPAAGAQPMAGVLASIVTAIFLHAGWLHLLGNMLFLWVFGGNVEDRMGHATFGLFYLFGGIVASLVQGVVDHASVVPTVGASGAVAAVLGSYLLFFPRSTVWALVPMLLFIPLPIPAVVMIGIWFLQNLLAGVATINNAAGADASVAWFAHVGGFLFGLAVAAFARPGSRPR